MELFIIPSCVGAVLALVLGLVRRFVGRFPYHVWLLVLLVMMAPIRIPHGERLVLPTRPVDPIEVILNAEQPEDAEPFAPVSASRPEADLLAFLWAAVGALLAMGHALDYLRFLNRVKRNSSPVECPELKVYTDRRVRVRVGTVSASPMLIGVIRPILLLPETPLSARELEFVLAHETTHLKRGDVLCKWIALAVRCFHWFNPAAYYAAAKFSEDSEISCDRAVIRGRSENEINAYLQTVLRLVSTVRTKPATTGMTGTGRRLKRRFLMVKRTEKKWTRPIICALVLVLIASAVVTGGVLAGETVGVKSAAVVELFGAPLKLEHPPREKNGTLYLPVRELLEKSGIDQENVTYEKGYFQFVHPLKTRILYEENVVNFLVHRIQVGAVECYMGPYYGTAENDTLSVPPIESEGEVYAPIEWYYRIKALGQGLFETLNVSSENAGELLWPIPESQTVSAPYLPGKHNGIDIAVREGAQVLAACSATVTEVGFDANYGNYVVLSDATGTEIRYAHLSKCLVSEGTTVSKGVLIAESGKTGMATGPNLHFEVKRDGEYQNPADHLG